MEHISNQVLNFLRNNERTVLPEIHVSTIIQWISIAWSSITETTVRNSFHCWTDINFNNHTFTYDEALAVRNAIAPDIVPETNVFEESIIDYSLHEEQECITHMMRASEVRLEVDIEALFNDSDSDNSDSDDSNTADDD
jgi:hypothetical protein